MSLDDQPLWDLFDEYPDSYESDLFDSVICEKTDISGFPVLYYVKLNPENSDDIYGEDPNEEFSDGYRTKILYEASEEIQVISIFGLSNDDTIQYAQIPKSNFSRDVTNDYLNDYTDESSLIPKPGDAIRTLWNNKLYQIVEVGAEQNIFQAQKFIWEFILRPYEHSEESDSANEMLFYEPDNDDFPNINFDTETKELSAYGDNSSITEEASGYGSDPDSSVYGY